MKKVIFPLALCLITAACGGDENGGTEPEMKISSCYVVSSSSGQSENFSSPVGMYITSEAGQPYEGSGVWSASYNSGAWAMDKPVYVMFFSSSTLCFSSLMSFLFCSASLCLYCSALTCS